tara:strand:+ start:6422 stop:7108 length:687 start_codon:yes stop_codon:yes gene_type:complete
MDKIDIKKPIIRSPKSVNNLSKSLKSKLKDNVDLKDKSSTNTQTKFKKIKLTPKSSTKKVQNKLFIPTELSVKPVEDKPVEDKSIEDKSKDVPKLDIKVDPTVIEVKPNLESTVSEVKPNIDKIKTSVNKTTVDKVKKSKKLNKRRLSRRKKSSKNKVVSVDLNNNNNSSKEKDIIEIINKFEKMNIKEIRTFLKNKGIDTKNNSKSKLMPYLYLLTCVDDDINVIKS